MTKTLKAICVILGIVCILSGLSPTGRPGTANAKDRPLKGVWAATLYSMDFPKTATTDAVQLKKDADALIDSVKEHGFNALFFQVRPSGDAFYKSEIFPWSRYLTGTEAAAPEGDFDVLSYMVDKAHQNGIALHAWINPYRLTVSENDSGQSDKSIAKLYPHLVIRHTDGKLYLNPGEPEAIDLVVKGAVEIVKNYQVDGLHIDDYFYPSSAFPDGEAFTKYGGSFLDIGDWRRSNTTRLVKKMGDAVKKENPDIIFSVSPSGIWANKSSHPDGSNTSGKQAYFDYYADTKGWVTDELVDMIIPQVYWEMGHPLADFKTVSDWWNDVAKGTDVALCIGQGIYKAAEATDAASVWYKENGCREIEAQLKYISGLEGVCGYSQYRIGNITGSPELSQLVKRLNASPPEIFSDTHRYPWAKEAVERLFKSGVINGMGDGSFGFERPVTRADFVVMLMRLTRQNVPFTENFDDVGEDKYYYSAVGSAKALGLASGREGNIFDAAGQITRQDMATLVWRAMVKLGSLPEKSRYSLEEKFSDANEILPYAKDAVAVLVEANVISGYETGEFKPNGTATRAECAVMLDRLKID